MRASGGMGLAIVLLAAGCAPTVGTFRHRYPDGRLQMQVPTRNGLMHGEAVTWHRDGSVASRGHYRDDEKVGVFTFYDARGALIRREVYVRGKRVWVSGDSAAEIPPSFASLADPDAGERAQLEEELAGPHPAFVAADTAQGHNGADGRFDLIVSDEIARRLAAGVEWYPGRIGSYGRLITADRGGADEHAFGKTVIEGGGLAGLRIAGHLLLVRAGVFLPVANDDTDGFFTEDVSAFSNVRDTALAIPHGLGARMSGSAIGRIGPTFGRIDLGVDYVQSIASDDSYPRLVGGRDVVIHSAAGAGFALWGALVTAELAGALTVRDSIDPPLAGVLSLQLPRGAWQPYVAAAVPVTRDDYGAAIAIMIGLAVTPADPGGRAPAFASSSTVVRREP